MSDFHQTGVVATLHRLETRSPEALERELETLAACRPVGLVLPCLFSEFDRPAIRRIIDELRGVRYLERVVVSLGPGGRRRSGRWSVRESPAARPDHLARRPRVQAFSRAVSHDAGLTRVGPGKGFACWFAYGLVAGRVSCLGHRLHDCDITTYDRELVARLCYPIVHPSLGFDFTKGYYARVSDRMNGRVTRLFMTPLLRVASGPRRPQPLLVYLDSFRYHWPASSR